MDGFESDIFTFRRTSDTSVLDDVVCKHGFRDESFLASLTEEEDLTELAPYIFGFQHITFN